MDGSIFDYWQAIVGLIAIVGVWIAWRQFRSGKKLTENNIRNGHRNKQQGGSGKTSNTIEGGNDNEQSG